MTENGNESDDDIAEDVLPVVVEQPAVPIELDELQAWHRPRKQVIREQQWLAYSNNLIRRIRDTPFLRLGLDGIREVKYLTLPGIDYLDVRLLANVCRDFDCVLTSTGFLAEKENTPIRARAQVREDALVKAGHITDRSITFSQRFEEVSSGSSQAYLDLRNRGPFHIVNIDACGSIAPPSANHANRMVDAIYKVVELQLAAPSGRWLLFLTADVRQDSFAVETLENLSSAIRKNALENEEFRVGASDVLAQDDILIEDAIANAMSGGNSQFLKLFALGFAKWLLHLADAKQWRLKMHDSYCYSTLPTPETGPTMPCLAFEFIPAAPGLPDPFGVTNANPAEGGGDENLSLRALNKVRNILDLDERLAADPQLKSEMINKTRMLLEEAGYAASALEQLETFGDPTVV